MLACPEHTGQLNRAANAAVGLGPEAEERDHWRVSGCSPALAALQPADGPHYHLTLPDVTALAELQILAAVSTGR